MNNFYKKGSKTLLLLSCTSILSALVNAPIASAAETEGDGQQIEAVLTTEEYSVSTYTFTPDTELEETVTELSEITETDTVLSGITFENAQIIVTFEDSSEIELHSDDLGAFEIDINNKDFKNQINIEVLDNEGNLLEKVTFNITDKTEPEEEPTSENTPRPTEPTAPIEPVEPSTPTEPQSPSVEPETSPTPAEKVKPEAHNNGISLFSIPAEPTGTTYYYVRKGETLYSITQKFNHLTVESLMKWNNFSNASQLKAGDIISINGMNNYEEYNQVNKVFSSNKEFIDFAGKYAKDVAKEYGLYASVMMAQTSLETGYGKSSLSSLANNFFGIKTGSGYSGYSIIMPTWEIVNGERVEVEASFRFHPSYAESFADNADKLRNGLSGNRNFYNGTWVENTNNFKDATLFLNQRYATDVNYHKKLNNIILSNNLTRFDSKPYKDFSYSVILVGNNYKIGNLPLNHRNAHGNVKVIDNTNKHLGAFLTVSQETVDGEYANIFLEGKELGWAHTDALLKINQELVNADFTAYVASKNTPIHSLPPGEKDNERVGVTGDLMNQKIHVTSQTKNGDQSYITKDGEGIGWVLTKDLAKAVSPKVVVLNSGSYTIDTLPWSKAGEHETISSTAQHLGQELEVVAVSQNSAYSLTKSNGKILGWIDNKALTDFKYKTINRTDYITASNYSVDTLPYGTVGFKKIGNTTSHLGKKVQVTKESANGAYWFVKSDGKNLGWVDKRAVGLSGKSYETLIAYENFSVDSLPWGTPGFKKVASTADYLNQKVQVAGSTKNGAYLLIRQNGNDIGWVDSKSVLPSDVSIVTPYREFIGATGFSLDSLPWGTPGFRTVGSTSEVLGQKVTVMAESKNRAYALISVNNKNLGWVDKKAFGLNQVSGLAVVTNGRYNVDTLPWGTPGFQKIGLTNEYINQPVNIIGTVKNGAYALISQNGQEIGWVDQRALSTTKAIAVDQYSTYVGGTGYSIDTLPWGTPGFKKVGLTSDILGKTVRITHESENRAYAYITVDGKPKGWVDKKAFGLNRANNSAVVINGRYNVDSLPWGTPGFKTQGLTSDYMGSLVRIIGSTHNGSYVLINKDNSNLGWVDSRSLQQLNTTTKNETNQIKQSGYSIDNLPWGTPGFKTISSTSDYLNKEVKVIAESSNKAYVFIQLNGKDLGWVDKRALK